MIFNLVCYSLVIAPMMEIKPSIFTLSYTFPKFVPGNELLIGSKKVNIETTNEGKTIINTVIYMIPELKYATELEVLLVQHQYLILE